MLGTGPEKFHADDVWLYRDARDLIGCYLGAKIRNRARTNQKRCRATCSLAVLHKKYGSLVADVVFYLLSEILLGIVFHLECCSSINHICYLGPATSIQPLKFKQFRNLKPQLQDLDPAVTFNAIPRGSRQDCIIFSLFGGLMRAKLGDGNVFSCFLLLVKPIPENWLLLITA